MRYRPSLLLKATILAFTMSSLLSGTTAVAALLYYEGFDYASGSLGNANGGYGFNSAWSNVGAGGSVNVQSGSLSYNGLATSGGKAFLQPTGDGGASITRNLNASFNTGTIYISLLANLSEGTRYFGLALDNNGGEAFLTGKPTTFGTQGAWSLSNNANLPGSPVSSGQAITLNTTVALVLRIDFNASGANERIRLYVNPTLGIEPSTANIDVISNVSLSVNQIRLTAGYTSSGSATAAGWMDEIRVGDDFASVTPVPEPATWMLAALGLTIVIARTRSRQTA